MPETGVVPGTREVSASDGVCKPTEESQKEYSPDVCDNMASGTQYTTIGGLAGSSQIKKAEEEPRREEEVRDLECQVEAARKRVQEQQAEVVYKGARITCYSQEMLHQSPLTEDTSTTCSLEPGLDKPKAPGSWTTAGHSHTYGSHAPNNFVISVSSSNVHASSNYCLAINGLTNTELFRVEPEMATLLYNISNKDLCSFAVKLIQNYERTGIIEDLNEAISIMEQVIDIMPQGSIYLASMLSNFGAMLGRRFERTGSMDNLNRAVDVADMAVNATPQDHPNRAGRLNNLGALLGRRFERTGLIDDLNRAVSVTDIAVNVTPQDHPDRASMLNNLGSWLGTRFERTGSIDDLNHAVDVADIAVNATPQDHPDRASRLNNFGNRLGRRFERTGSMDDLNCAVNVIDMAVNVTPQDHPDRVSMLNSFGSWLGRRFERTGLMDDLNRAVDVADMAVNATPQDHPNRAGRLNNLGALLGRRFERTGSIDDLNRAVNVADMAVNATPQDHPNQTSMLNNLGSWLGKRFEWTGSIDDLNRAVDVADIAVNATPQDHPDRASMLNNLGSWLGRRFERTGSMDDLNRAVDVTDMAVNATPQDHPDQAGWLNNLGSWLGTRFERTGSIDDLNRAVDVADTAANATPQDHPNRAGRLNNIGRWLGKRFERTGSMDDLNRAVDVADMAVNATPQDHPDRASMLTNLGNQLGTRFERTGSMDDLNHAIDVTDMAVNATPQDHPNRASMLTNLGNRLGRRFEWTGLMDDLNRAVDVADMAVNVTLQDHPDRAGRLNNLGSWLGKRFERTGSIDDLNRAVNVADMAINATPQDHPDRAGRLNNLGSWLGRRFERTGSIDDLNRAIDVADIAVNATPQDHHNRAGILTNLGNRLGRRFERTGSMDDLNRAVNVADMAVNATPQDHPDRAGMLKNLGNRLGRRFEQTRSMDDLNHSLSYSKEGWACHSSPPSIRIHLARRAANILAFQLNWEESSNFLQGAIKLLPLVSPRLLENNDKQHILGDFAGLASMAAAISLKAGKDQHYALELLELGRCVIAGILLEMRTDISALKKRHPKLAAEFESLRDELDLPSRQTAPPSDTAPLWKSQANQRFKAEQKFNEVIATIRDQPRFQNFLLPPTCDELMAAADQGPIIIINISSYRCDAFLVEHYRIRVLSLPNLREEELEEKIRHLSAGSTSTLQWLWDVAAGPILDALGYRHPPSENTWPHVWWIPTGTLSRFPIHAAGYHTKGSTKTVLDRVMSSYSSSIKALVYGRRYSVQTPTECALKHALLVAMQDTPCLLGNSILPFATREVEMLANLCPSLQLKPVMPPQRREEVLAHLRACQIFHFAGHGRLDPLDPSKSCLLLESPLTVGDLRDYKIQESSPFLSYLSACSTSANKVDRLVDEGIHLVSAFQLAGFRHVIGTLWEVSDSYCVDVARVVYETIRDEGMTDIAICRGLHEAVRALRDGRIESTGEAGKNNNTEAGGNPGVPGVAEVNNGSAKVAQEVDDDKAQAQACSSTTTPQKNSEPTFKETANVGGKDSRAKKDAMADYRNSRKAAGGDKRGITQLARDAELCDESCETTLQSPLYWAPYVHFGV